MHSRPRKLLAEFLGTFGLVLVATGALCADQFLKSSNQPGLGLLGTSLAYGFAAAAVFTALSHVSGGHFNPAVTVSFWVARKIDTFDTLTYWAAQLGGAVTAAYLLRAVVPDDVWSTILLGTPALAGGITRASGMIIEGTLTFLLAVVVFAASADTRLGGFAGAAVGAAITGGAMFGGPFTGGSMNPARAFASALAAHHWTNHGVYWIGPLAGGLVAAAFHNLLFSRAYSRPE